MAQFPSSQHPPSLLSVRNSLLESGWYLGDQAHAFRDKVVWRRTGSGHCLFTKDSADAADAADNARAAEDLESDNKAAVKDVVLEPAVLSVVITIRSNNCWLIPCRYWNGPRQAAKRFEDVKLNFDGQCPPQRFTLFAQDFQHVINNTNWIFNEVAVRDSGVTSTGFLTPRDSILTFRHVLFQVIPDIDSGSETDSEATIDSDEEDFPLADWPVIHEAAVVARDELVSKMTHRVVPLPAYDINGDLIPPTRYQNALRDALVRVDFTLSHWFIDEKSSNRFTADVKKIRILVNPHTPSPQKRKVPLRDPDESSPSKKSRNM